MRFWFRPGLGLFSLAFVLLIAELTLRQREDIAFELEYRRAHCLVERFILLCPQRQNRLRAGSRIFTLTTNSRGERVASSSGQERIIVLGDSLSMGYGLSDEETLAHLLGQKGHPARNLAVDSLGPSGMEFFLSRNVAGLVSRYVWVFSPSDFVDEAKPERGPLLYTLYRFYFFARKHPALLAWHRSGAARPVAQNLPPSMPPPDHPAWAAMERIFLQRRPLLLLFYPAAPDASMDIEREVARFARGHGVEILWLEDEFRDAVRQGRSADLYIPGDGHPGPLAALLFADAVLSRIQ